MSSPGSRLAVTLALLVVVAGCSEGSETAGARPSATPTTRGPGVQLAEPLLQDRLDATRRMIGIPLTNGGPGTARVLRVQLVTPHFATTPPATVDADLAPDQQINFAFPYGAARCEPDAAKQRPVVLVDVDAGGRRQLRLTPPTPVKILDQLRDVECQQRELETAFDVTWGPTWTRVPARSGEAQRLSGELRLTLRPKAGPVTATALRGSVMFAIATVPADREPIASLDAKTTSASVPVEVSVRLCSKHGLTEAKKLFVFTLAAQLGGDPPRYRTIEPPAAVSQQILALLGTCPPEY